MNSKTIIDQLRNTRSKVIGIARSINSRSDWVKSMQTIDSTGFTIAVVGEFSSGKSTLINALLGLDLLPTNLNPTTAHLTLIKYAEKHDIKIHYSNGSVKSIEPSNSALKKFTFLHSHPDSAEIRYIEVFWSSPILRSISIVDTPGTNDLSKTSLELSNHILRQANAVLVCFTHPVNRSVIDFLKAHVFAYERDAYRFIMNRVDMNMPEDYPAMKAYTRKMLDRYCQDDKSSEPIIMCSARNALREVVETGEIRDPGVRILLNEIYSLNRDIIKNPAWIDTKKSFARNVAKSMNKEIESELKLLHADDADFLKQEKGLKTLIDKRDSKLNVMYGMVSDSFARLEAELIDELNSLEQNIKRQINYEIQMFQGDIKNLPLKLENTLSNTMQNWQNTTRPKIERFQMNLMKELQSQIISTFKKDVEHIPQIQLDLVEDKMTNIFRPIEGQDALEEMILKDRVSANLVSGAIGGVVGGLGALMLGTMSFLTVPAAIIGYLIADRKYKNLVDREKSRLSVETDNHIKRKVTESKENIISHINNLKQYYENKVAEIFNSSIEQTQDKLRLIKSEKEKSIENSSRYKTLIRAKNDLRSILNDLDT